MDGAAPAATIVVLIQVHHQPMAVHVATATLEMAFVLVLQLAALSTDGVAPVRRTVVLAQPHHLHRVVHVVEGTLETGFVRFLPLLSPPYSQRHSQLRLPLQCRRNGQLHVPLQCQRDDQLVVLRVDRQHRQLLAQLKCQPHLRHRIQLSFQLLLQRHSPQFLVTVAQRLVIVVPPATTVVHQK